MSAPIVRCDSVVRIHRTDEVEVVALRGVDLTVAPGEMVGLLGPSGSGKSTLLTLLAGLASPSAGRLEVLGRDVGRLTERERLALRRNDVGVVLQNPERNLLPYGRVIDNLTFAVRGRRRDRRRRAHELLDAVGLSGAARKRIRALSGGEQQRLGVAVALANEPSLLLADEPTSQLDAANGAHVADLLAEARDQRGATVVVVTHDARLGARMDRTLAMRDGRIGTEARRDQHPGEDLAVVAADGSVQLPLSALEQFPPGSRARFVAQDDHLALYPVPEADR